LLTQANKNNLLYTSREFDFETGLQFNRMRYYLPNLGRFTQKDISFDLFNKYIYAENSSLNYFDPFGNSVFGSIGCFISISIGSCEDWRAYAGCTAICWGMAYIFGIICSERFEKCTENCSPFDIDCLDNCWEEWASCQRAITAFLCSCFAECRYLTCGDSDFLDEDFSWT
jgi:RHS repeat-associated protein